MYAIRSYYASGDEFRALLEQIRSGGIPLDILCLEGAVIRGPSGSGRFHLMAGTGQPMMEWIDTFARLAKYVVAVGSCAADGGITAGGGNPGDACGLQYDGTERNNFV